MRADKVRWRGGRRALAALPEHSDQSFRPEIGAYAATMFRGGEKVLYKVTMLGEGEKVVCEVPGVRSVYGRT